MCVTVVWPLGVGAQQPRKLHHVAFIAATSPVSELIGADPSNPAARGFVHGLRALGYTEGRNLVLEWRSAEGKYQRFSEIVRELVSMKVDVIVTVTNLMTRVAKDVPQTIPIVMAANTNPVEDGLIASLARPGGNVTGLTRDTGSEMNGRRLEFLKELLPTTSRVAFLHSRRQIADRHVAETAARILGHLSAASRTPSLP
jgi:putative ABC transport system substrate-binding protein